MDYEQVLPYIPNLRRYARALVGDRDAADDLVQDTLERAVRKFHLWRPGNLRAWLFSIMHNVFVNQLKSRRASLTEELDENHTGLAGTADAGAAAQVRDLERGLAGLSPEHREVLLMVGLEDMSYEEVSRALGVPMGTVMSRLSRAREKLRRHLDGEPAQAGLKVVK
ncbi:MAG: RNA polymerase sigma factor [Burkholderiales bacterium]|nr:RNA polymerase sigma factor [Burkholderiales bacterium]